MTDINGKIKLYILFRDFCKILSLTFKQNFNKNRLKHASDNDQIGKELEFNIQSYTNPAFEVHIT